MCMSFLLGMLQARVSRLRGKRKHISYGCSGGADLRVAGQIEVQKRANILTRGLAVVALWNSEGADGEEGREDDCEFHV
jgi:hypothetical protein